MALYALICEDHRDSAAIREKTREDHLAYCRGPGSPVRLAGALLSEDGKPEGSLLILECEGLAGAEAFAKGDPYAKAGLFSSVRIKPWRVAVGELG